MNRTILFFLTSFLLLSLTSCKQQKGQQAENKVEENQQAKKLLQGVWLDDDEGDVSFRVKGDTIYYPDSTSAPAYFFIVNDTLKIKGANEVDYAIVKQAEHLFEFKTQSGDVLRLVKTSDPSYLKAFEHTRPMTLNQNTLLKRDTVVTYADKSYHLYMQVNPTSYKVYKSSYNDDGVQVDNVYYDNIVNINVYQGASKLFSRDFQKADFNGAVPSQFISQAILSDVVFDSASAEGIRFLAVLAMPDSSLSYEVVVNIAYNGKMTISKKMN